MFKASYMVLGLGDVYLGAPCAVPVDPRHVFCDFLQHDYCRQSRQTLLLAEDLSSFTQMLLSTMPAGMHLLSPAWKLFHTSTSAV